MFKLNCRHRALRDAPRTGHKRILMQKLIRNKRDPGERKLSSDRGKIV
jgi:hypothetical protein